MAAAATVPSSSTCTSSEDAQVPTVEFKPDLSGVEVAESAQSDINDDNHETKIKIANSNEESPTLSNKVIDSSKIIDSKPAVVIKPEPSSTLSENNHVTSVEDSLSSSSTTKNRQHDNKEAAIRETEMAAHKAAMQTLAAVAAAASVPSLSSSSSSSSSYNMAALIAAASSVSNSPTRQSTPTTVAAATSGPPLPPPLFFPPPIGISNNSSANNSNNTSSTKTGQKLPTTPFPHLPPAPPGSVPDSFNPYSSLLPTGFPGIPPLSNFSNTTTTSQDLFMSKFLVSTILRKTKSYVII